MSFCARVLLVVVAVSVLFSHASAQEVLTNQAVIEMVRAGLSEAVIIAKIRSTQTKFDLQTDALVKLKQAGITDKVLETMVSGGAPSTGTLPAPPSPGVPGTAGTPVARDREVIYHVTGDKYVELIPTVGEKETNIGFFTLKDELVLSGRRARYRIAERQPVFYSAYSITEVPLVRLKPGDDHDDRNLKMFSGSVFSMRRGIRSEDKIDVVAEKDHRGLFRIVPRTPLPPGEYGFVNPQGNKIYDFGID
jgi:hypothetical protein